MDLPLENGVSGMSPTFIVCFAGWKSSMNHLNGTRVMYYGVRSMNYMFGDCRRFNQSLLKFNTSNVTDMRMMFSGCLAFNQDISNFDTSKVTRMDAMFRYWKAFQQDISNFDTSKVARMYIYRKY